MSGWTSTEKVLAVLFAVTIFVILANVAFMTSSAVKNKNQCEYYRYSRQVDTPVACLEYLKQHP